MGAALEAVSAAAVVLEEDSRQLGIRSEELGITQLSNFQLFN